MDSAADLRGRMCYLLSVSFYLFFFTYSSRLNSISNFQIASFPSCKVIESVFHPIICICSVSDHPKIEGPIPYERLPKVAKMMLKYCGVEYDPEVHSPSMDQDDTPHWLTDEAQGESI